MPPSLRPSTHEFMNKPIRLVQFTDCHLYGDPGERLRGIATLESLKAMVDQAVRAQRGWDATLLTGDLVHDDPGGYAHIRDVFGAFDHPVHCLPGNHDDPVAMRRVLANPPFVHGGHAELGDWLIVMLDSCRANSADGTLSIQELGRLDNLLSRRSAPHALVCLHHHPVRMGSRWLDQVGLTNPADLFAVIDAHPQVRGILWGHVHQQYDGRRGAVRLFGTPSTCVQFMPGIDGFAIDRRPPGYRRLELSHDGSIDTSVEWAAAAEPGQHAQIA